MSMTHNNGAEDGGPIPPADTRDGSDRLERFARSFLPEALSKRSYVLPFLTGIVFGLALVPLISEDTRIILTIFLVPAWWLIDYIWEMIEL